MNHCDQGEGREGDLLCVDVAWDCTLNIAAKEENNSD